jgi:hypothetical protein
MRSDELAAFVITTLRRTDIKAAQTALAHAATLYGPSMLSYIAASPDLLATAMPPGIPVNIQPTDPNQA